MAWTPDDVEALEDAIKSGELSVTYRDKSATYRSLDDMLKLRDLMRRELGLSGSLSFDDRARHGSTKKGID